LGSREIVKSLDSWCLPPRGNYSKGGETRGTEKGGRMERSERKEGGQAPAGVTDEGVTPALWGGNGERETRDSKKGGKKSRHGEKRGGGKGLEEGATIRKSGLIRGEVPRSGLKIKGGRGAGARGGGGGI